MSSLPAARTAPQLKRPNRPFQADGTFLTSVPSWSRPGSAAPAKKKEDDAEALLRARKLRAAAFAFKTARVVVKFKRLAPPAPRVDRQKVLSAYAKSSNLVKSGLMTRPTLISHRPAWYEPPPEVTHAAQEFDERHQRRSARCERCMMAVKEDPDSIAKNVIFTKALNDVKFSRFFVPENADEVPEPIEAKAVRKNDHVVVGETWNLGISIFGPRNKEADSGEYDDTEAMLRKSLEMSWRRCLDSHNTVAFLTKLDKSEGVVEACFDVLWDACAFLYGCFDYYATVGGHEDVLLVTKPGYKRLIEDCHLILPGSKHANATAFDQLFVLLNAKGSDNAHALDRQEWLQMLLRMAAMLYVSPGHIEGVPAALKELITVDLMPNVDRRSLQDSHTFRSEFMYLQDVDEILRLFEKSLRAIFNVYAAIGSQVGDELQSGTRLGWAQYRLLASDLALFDEDFKDRELSLVFAWSRLRVVDEKSLKSRVKRTQLSFEDLLECLLRISTLKVLPSQEEVFDSGCDDGGELLLQMKEKEPEKHAKFIADNIRNWDDPLPDTIVRLVETLLYLIVRTVLKRLKEEGVDDGHLRPLSQKDVIRFRAVCALRDGTG